MREALHVMSGKRTVEFGAEEFSVGSDLPPLELRTAYTAKGLGIGAGGLVGYLLWGPLGLVLLGFAGWYIGNSMAIRAEKEFVRSTS